MKRLVLLALVAALIAAFFAFDLGRLLTLNALTDLPYTNGANRRNLLAKRLT